MNIWKTWLLVCLSLFSSYYLYQNYSKPLNQNSLMVLTPYRHAGTWVFDDSRVGLRQEPFVAGIPEMIDQLVEKIPNAPSGFRMIFSSQPFPEHELKLIWKRAEAGGNWYHCEQYQKEGWLCPALFKYYESAPKEIFVKAEPLSNTM